MRDRLGEMEHRLSELRTEKEVLKARYEGAEAMEDVNETMAEGMGDVSVEGTVNDIEEDIVQMQSRAEAINELENEQETIDDELEELATDSEVSAEMETLRGEFAENDPSFEELPDEIEDEDELERAKA